MNVFKKALGIACFVLLTTVASAQKVVKKYLKRYEALALELSDKHRIPVSIILGVSIVESDAGRSLICRSLNNFFGIKGKNTSSEKAMGYKSAYKEYKTDEESFEHFCQVLKKKRFYASLKGNADFREWLKQMNKAEYASAKQKWIDQITKTIVLFDLTKLDNKVAQQVALK